MRFCFSLCFFVLLIGYSQAAEVAEVSLKGKMQVRLADGGIVVEHGKVVKRYGLNRLSQSALGSIEFNRKVKKAEPFRGVQMKLVPRLVKSLPSDKLMGKPVKLMEKTLVLDHLILGQIEVKREFLAEARQVGVDRTGTLQKLLPLPEVDNEIRMNQNDAMIELTDGTRMIFEITAIGVKGLTVSHQAIVKPLFIPTEKIQALTFQLYREY